MKNKHIWGNNKLGLTKKRNNDSPNDANSTNTKSSHNNPKTPNEKTSIKTNDKPEGIRLNKRMSELGLCSRREADAFIDAGKVTVDGVLAHHPGQRVEAHQRIVLDTRDSESERLSIVLHKPVGYVSGLPEDNHEPALRLIRKENYVSVSQHTREQSSNKAHKNTHDNQWPESFEAPTAFPKNFKGLAPCGRLDINSEGLIIFSNDGRVAKAIISPDSLIDKEYLIRFYGECTEEQIALLKHGIELDGSPLKPAGVEQINESQLRLTLKEGKKRQIRRMCDIVGLPISKLQRTRVGPITLSSLPLGKWRVLSEREVDDILAYQAKAID